jgi:glutamine synthetase
MENYDTTIKIEGELALDMAMTMILPAAIQQQQIISDNILKLKEVGVKSGNSEMKKHLDNIGKNIAALWKSSELLKKAVDADKSDKIIAEMDKLRVAVDALEREVDDAIWPLPKYSEMLFIY